MPQRRSGNALLGGKTIALDTSDCLVRLPAGKLAVLKDLQNYIVVDEEDVLLVFPKSKEQEIKQVTALVKAETGDKYL
ncbi:MAG: hypothetical protein R2778_13100 [Saprospiraceae bacterium]